MRSRTTPRFRETLADLPEGVQRAARRAYRLFAADANHPSLQFKRVHAGESLYSARVSLSYRALAIIENDEAIWLWIGSHAEYDQLLRDLRRG